MNENEPTHPEEPADTATASAPALPAAAAEGKAQAQAEVSAALELNTSAPPEDPTAEPNALEDSEGGTSADEALPQLPPWSELSQARRQSVIEALIFASDQPLTLKDLRGLLGVRSAELLRQIDAIQEDISRHNRGLVLEEIGGGYIFRTRPELSPWVRALVKTRPPRLSRAALECLAIIAYKQPCTRAEIEQVRGVESGHLVRGLLEKRLVRILGRKEDVGRPMIYGTTREFLQMFGLKDLTALPTLRDLSALMGKAQGPEPVGVDSSVLELPDGTSEGPSE